MEPIQATKTEGIANNQLSVDCPDCGTRTTINPRPDWGRSPIGTAYCQNCTAQIKLIGVIED